MALIKCLECNKKISEKAKFCPHCGNPNLITKNPIIEDTFKQYPLREPKRVIRPGAWIFGISTIIFGLWLAFNIIPKYDKSKAKTIDLISDVFTNQNNYFDSDMIRNMYLFSYFIVGFGLIIIVIGGTKKDGIIFYCDKCKRQVNGVKIPFYDQWECEICRDKNNLRA